MGKETAIKVSKEFKEFLVANKKEGEDFESTIKRMVNYENLNSEPVNHKKVKQLTSKPEEYRKIINTPNTETSYKKDLSTKEGRDVERKRLDEEHKNLPELPDKELSYDELPSEIGGVRIKP